MIQELRGHGAKIDYHPPRVELIKDRQLDATAPSGLGMAIAGPGPQTS